MSASSRTASRKTANKTAASAGRRPGPLVYGLLAAFVIGSALPLYWSFVIGSVTK